MDTLRIPKPANPPRSGSWRTGLSEEQIQALPPVGYIDLIVEPTSNLGLGVHVPPWSELVGKRLRVHHLTPGGFALYRADCVNRLGRDMDFTTTVSKRHVRGKAMVPVIELTGEERAALRGEKEI